jgi:hypothetical protein
MISTGKSDINPPFWNREKRKTYSYLPILQPEGKEKES